SSCTNRSSTSAMKNVTPFQLIERPKPDSANPIVDPVCPAWMSDGRSEPCCASAGSRNCAGHLKSIGARVNTKPHKCLSFQPWPKPSLHSLAHLPVEFAFNTLQIIYYFARRS